MAQRCVNHQLLTTCSLAHTRTPQDKQVARWLRILMRDGQAAIDKFLANPVNIKQQKLAEHYQRAVEAAEDESYSLTR